MTHDPIKVIIADDHPLFRRGLKHAFSETEDIQVSGEAESGEDLLKQIKSSDATVVLLDISMPGKNTLEVLKQIKTDNPGLPVLMLSVHPEEQYAARFIRAGASGYLNKESAADKLVEATRKLAHGGKFVSPRTMEILAFDFSDTDKPLHESLSNREYQVFGMIAGGKSLTEIGKELSLSVKTISTHRTRLLEKMKMKNNAELIHYAITNNLI
ncbi:MAG: response regulator transcription factor [Nitrospinaceae bacterium]